jgi:hypothetical protein
MVDGETVPPGDGVDPEAQRAHLVLHAAFMTVRQSAEAAEEHPARQGAAGLADVQLRPDHPAVVLHVDDRQQVERLKMRP